MDKEEACTAKQYLVGPDENELSVLTLLNLKAFLDMLDFGCRECLTCSNCSGFEHPQNLQFSTSEMLKDTIVAYLSPDRIYSKLRYMLRKQKPLIEIQRVVFCAFNAPVAIIEKDV